MPIDPTRLPTPGTPTPPQTSGSSYLSPHDPEFNLPIAIPSPDTSPKSGSTSSTAEDPTGGLRFVTGPGGRIFAYSTNPLTGEQKFEGSYDPRTDGAGGKGSFNDQLDAAKSAVSAYLQASSLSDARKLNAFQEMQKIAQFALPQGATQFPGFEQNGLAHALTAQLGMKQYTPPPMTPIAMNPSALGAPGQIDPTAMSMIDRIMGAAGARGGASAPTG